MKSSFHEDFTRAEKIKGGSDRSFGLTVGAILLLIALVRAWFHGLGWTQYGLGGAGVLLIVLGLALPQSLSLPNRAWTRLGLILFKVVNPIVLALIYGLAILPIGLLMRVIGRDLLHLRIDSAANSYWVVRDPPGPPPETMINQF